MMTEWTEWSSEASPAVLESGEAMQRSKLPWWGEWGIREVFQNGVRVSVCLYNFGNYEESDVKAFEEELWEK